MHPSVDKNQIRTGAILIVISATGFGFLGIFAKYAFAAKVNVITLSAFRFLIASAIIWLVLLVRRESPRVTGKQLAALLALGVSGYAVMSSLYFSAVELIPASLTAIIMFTYPVMVTLLSSRINRERITRHIVFSLLLSFSGLVLVVGPVIQGLNLKGAAFAGVNAIIYSLFIVLSNRLVGKLNPLVVTAYISSSAAITLTLVGLSTGSLDFAFNTGGWLAVVGTAVFSTSVAILTFFQGMRVVGPSRASIISALEPVVAALASFMLFAEKLNLAQMTGGIMIISAVVLVQKER